MECHQQQNTLVNSCTSHTCLAQAAAAGQTTASSALCASVKMLIVMNITTKLSCKQM